MRVLTAAHYWPPHVGGVEFEAREQSRRLVARGHQVVVERNAGQGIGVDDVDCRMITNGA